LNVGEILDRALLPLVARRSGVVQPPLAPRRGERGNTKPALALPV